MFVWLPRLVARVPASVHAKLLGAFLVIVVLLVIVGAVGLKALYTVNRRADELLQLERNMALYRQLQHDTTAQLYGVTLALLVPEEQTLETTLRQLSTFGYDVEKLQYIAQEEVELLGRVGKDYERFVEVATRVVELIRRDQASEGRELQLTQAGPLAERLQRLMNELVNKAEAEMVDSVITGHSAYLTAQWTVIGFAVGSILLAILLGYAISWSLVGPVKAMDERLRQIASGDFSKQVEVINRDELGALAANLNHMNEELERLYQQLEAVNRHKSQFLANMSHELRTPLNAIIGFSEVLNERMFGDLNEKQAEYVQDIHSSGRHLHALINDILDLSKIEAGHMELEIAPFDLPVSIDSALTFVRERAKRHGIALDVSVDERLGLFTGDERKFRQILLNLLANAVKFTQEGGKIDVIAVPAPGAVEVSIADSGIGIPAADQEVIFDEFRQAKSVDGRAREGTGLGLALTRKFVEMHGGTIWVRSEPGKGATFTFNLPMRP